MSWQLASFAIVLGGLGAAFWWYERSEPPAKLLAVVATLAALAALGRDAFAAVPDVKPITAIVLVGGLAFGARPGFAIGAISALASNILLGEGPWTPWQMLGWGLVGLLGAALGGLLRGRRPPALVLALACAASAELFNLVVDLYTWTGTGNHTVAGFGLVLGSAVAFDLTHVAASFAFGLAFGPGLLRMLMRIRARLQVTWADGEAATPRRGLPGAALLGGPPAAIALMLCVPVLALGVTACAGAMTPAGSAGGPRSEGSRALVVRELAYLVSAQNSDGGFGAAPGLHSAELYSAWAAMGIAAAGRSPLTVSRNGHTVIDSIDAEAGTLSGAGDLERTILALHACGVSVHSLPGGDPVKRLLAFRAPDGSFGHLANLTAFGVLALRAAGYGPRSAGVSAAGSWLVRQQDSDGGFGFATRGGGSDVDDTAAVMQALAAAAPRRAAVLARAFAYLRRAQNLDGGFSEQTGGSSNAQSTAWAIQGLIAAGRDPARVRRAGSASPPAYLQSLVMGDGSVRYSRTGAQTPVWVTAQVLTALAGRTLPVSPPRR
jgi:energy-coupling factor transport system substrate-specific component